MKLITLPTAFLIFILVISCDNEDFDSDVEIPDFNFLETTTFEASLSAYVIFEGSPADLIPSEDYKLLELSSVLFTDYAHKQRLVKVPAGTSITRLNNGSLEFPDGTILTKTFFYYNDERDPSLGKRIIETRLEIKESGTWNIATYLWNDAQTEAILALDGIDTEVSWITENGETRSILYHVPTQNECMTCHQSSSHMSPIGPTLLNLNRDVFRNGTAINQIDHMQSLGILNDFLIDQLPKMVDYKDTSAPLAERGRAYLAMNCSHCHNPDAWDTPAERDFDFRYETTFSQSGIQNGKDKISRNVLDQEMPLIGTTILDDEGVNLIVEYLESL